MTAVLPFLLLSWVTGAAPAAVHPPPAAGGVLIVYLSRTGNTQAVAKLIQERTGGTLLALELVTPYPEDYRATVEQVARENASGYLPPLTSQVDVSRYDFNTNAGYGVGSGFAEVRQRCAECRVREGIVLEGGIERDGVLFVMEGQRAARAASRVQEWLRRLGIRTEQLRP